MTPLTISVDHATTCRRLGPKFLCVFSLQIITKLKQGEAVDDEEQ